MREVVRGNSWNLQRRGQRYESSKAYRTGGALPIRLITWRASWWPSPGRHLRFLALGGEVAAGQDRFGNGGGDTSSMHIPPQGLRRLGAGCGPGRVARIGRDSRGRFLGLTSPPALALRLRRAQSQHIVGDHVQVRFLGIGVDAISSWRPIRRGGAGNNWPSASWNACADAASPSVSGRFPSGSVTSTPWACSSPLRRALRKSR